MPDPASSDAAPTSSVKTNPRNRVWVFIATLATMFMVAIEQTIVATAMPTIVGQLGSFELFSWVFTAYLLTQAVTIPIYGRLSDLLGRKRILLFGFGVFLIGSALCGLAWSMLSLIAFRAVQGIGAGAVLPVAMTLVSDLYSPAERARIQGLLSGVWGAAAVLGPLVGAFLVAHAGWAAVFWINLPLGILAGGMIAVSLHEQVQRRQHRIDMLGSVMMVIGTGCLMFALVQAASLTMPVLLGLIAVGVIALAIFFFHEYVTPEPMLPLRLWRNPIIAGATLVYFGVGALLMASTAFLPAYIQGVLGYSALLAGSILAVMSVLWSFGSTFGGQIMLRSSYRISATVGGLVLIAGSGMMLTLDPGRSVTLALIGACLSGYGMGGISNTFLVAVQSNVAWHERGVATSTIVFMRMMGQAVGTAVFGGIVNAVLSRRIPGGGDLVNRILDPMQRETLPPEQMAPLMRAFADGLQDVYLIGALLSVIVFGAVATLPRGLSPVRQAVPRR